MNSIPLGFNPDQHTMKKQATMISNEMSVIGNFFLFFIELAQLLFLIDIVFS